jgi:hypothetical protein
LRGFLLGLVVFVGLTVTVLSVRPGGLRLQLKLVARRFRIMLVLGGIFVLGSAGIRLAFSSGPLLDFGPVALAAALALGFMIWGRDPAMTEPGPTNPRRP